MRRVAFTVVPLVALALAASGCGSQSNSVPKDSDYYHGAQLFSEHCAGCHSLDAVGAEGSASNVRNKEKTDGPNFNQRKENVPDILYAIRNGGFSGYVMPQDLVTGDDAQAVAEFLAHYSGKDAKQAPSLEPTPSSR